VISIITEMRRSHHKTHHHQVRRLPSDDTVTSDAHQEESFNHEIMQGLMEIRKIKNSKKKIKSNHRKYSTDTDADSTTKNFDDPLSTKSSPYDQQASYEEEQHQIQKVHEELYDINNKLQYENKRLRQWDVSLRKRESHLDEVEEKLNNYAASLQEIIEKEVASRCQNVEQEYEQHKMELQSETRKTRNSFKIMQKANENLKSQVAINNEKIKRYEEKQTALQNRITNLQRKNEILNEQTQQQSSISSSSVVNKHVKNHKLKPSSQTPAFYESFSTLLSWISNVHIKSSVESLLKVKQSQLLSTEHDVNIEVTNDNCIKIIISLPSILAQISLLDDKLQIAFLQFVYWSILHLHLTQSSLRFTHAATYRRIGEELYNLKSIKCTKSDEDQHSFVRSLNIQIRLLSSLIIIHTVTQADLIAQVYRLLTAELRNEMVKDIFLRLHGTVILLPNFKPSNKNTLTFTTDILMVMTAESPYLQSFLESISNIEWVQAIMNTMKNSQEDNNIMEKSSLLLQRLSKLRSNKTIFEALQTRKFINDYIRNIHPDEEFLQLNLRSILFNIDAMKIKT